MLKVENAFFSYRNEPIIKKISFSVAKGQILGLLGESGCGKTTLLKLIYGLYDLNDGRITFNDKPIRGPKFNLIPGEHNIKYLAQDFDLMPFITVAENVGKFLSNAAVANKRQRIEELLAMVEMSKFAETKTQFLSGGQMQRVALARVLALEPELLLLDEPFSQIDAFRRGRLSRNLFSYLKERQISCVFATHDSADVFSFTDEVVIVKEGTLVQQGNPQTIHSAPSNKYVATLFGEVNEIQAHYLSDSGVADQLLLVYAYQLKIVGISNLKVVVKRSFFRGSHYLIEAEYENGTLFFENETEIGEKSVCYLKHRL